MYDRLQPAKRRRVVKNQIAEPGPIYRTVAYRVRERLANRSDGGATMYKKPVHGGIGIVKPVPGALTTLPAASSQK